VPLKPEDGVLPQNVFDHPLPIGWPIFVTFHVGDLSNIYNWSCGVIRCPGASLNNVPVSTLGNTGWRKNTKFSVTLRTFSRTYATLSLKQSPHTSFSSRFSFPFETCTSAPTVTIARRFSGNKTADVKVCCASLFSQTGPGTLMPKCLGVWEINTGYANLVDSEHVNGSSENLIYMPFVTEICYKHSAEVVTYMIVETILVFSCTLVYNNQSNWYRTVYVQKLYRWLCCCGLKKPW